MQYSGNQINFALTFRQWFIITRTIVMSVQRSSKDRYNDIRNRSLQSRRRRTDTSTTPVGSRLGQSLSLSEQQTYICVSDPWMEIRTGQPPSSNTSVRRCLIVTDKAQQRQNYNRLGASDILPPSQSLLSHRTCGHIQYLVPGTNWLTTDRLLLRSSLLGSARWTALPLPSPVTCDNKAFIR